MGAGARPEANLSLRPAAGDDRAGAARGPTIDGGLKSVILLDDGKVYEKSGAVIRITARIGGIYAVAAIFMGSSRLLRDWVYGVIAKNRYRWFGKRDTCRLPSPEERALFLD